MVALTNSHFTYSLELKDLVEYLDLDPTSFVSLSSDSLSAELQLMHP
jgi:hypothetical protein